MRIDRIIGEEIISQKCKDLVSGNQYHLLALYWNEVISKDMKTQTQDWSDQSYRYVSSYLNDPTHTNIAEIFSNHLPKLPHSSKILDVGCGNGSFLKYVVDFFGAGKGVGVEPSQEAVDLLKNKYYNEDSLEFKAVSSHSLPFESDEFDLVTIWSVLHWVGRNEYLQSLGELIRVSRKYILVMDFVGSRDYKTPYSHKRGFYTYKMDFEIPLLASGILNKMAECRWVIEGGNMVPISEEDLTPFEEKSANWGARKMILFEKNYDALPTIEADIFKVQE